MTEPAADLQPTEGSATEAGSLRAARPPGPEAFTLTLTLGGRHAGEQHWTLTPERSALVARVTTEFGGVLPSIRRAQTSRLHPRHLTSLSYSEGDGRGRASFETTFDRKAGVITLRQGKDEATAPLTTEHHDPVSLLLWLRAVAATPDGGPERTHAHLTGGRVLIQRLPETGTGGTEVDGQPARGYFLRPGNAYVYVEAVEPYRLLRLIQPTDFGPVEANLGTLSTRRPEREQAQNRRRRGR